jgi:hypothetical protein
MTQDEDDDDAAPLERTEKGKEICAQVLEAVELEHHGLAEVAAAAAGRNVGLMFHVRLTSPRDVVDTFFFPDQPGWEAPQVKRLVTRRLAAALLSAIDDDYARLLLEVGAEIGAHRGEVVFAFGMRLTPEPELLGMRGWFPANPS